MFKPRPAQAEILRYRSGRMGVSAVPGSGKTHTLSNLAFQLIHEGHIQEGQEVLVVTLVNSAVDNFAHRIESFLKEAGLLPGMGYRVRTLHGLAHDVVRERPDLVGLSNDFQIIDEREANEILRESSQLWLRSHPEFIQEYGNPNADPYQDHRLQSDWYKLIFDVASSFIRQAKDLQATPAAVQEAYARLEQRYPLIEMGVEIYNDYQRALSYRGAVDFDDLIRLALQAMQTDPTYLARLRQRWPYILEDEAQDSSRLQEKILRLLSGEQGNWVRMGDPNQAIYESFTTANPRYLLDFLKKPGVVDRSLPTSGRSTLSIIRLANELNRWVQEEHPNPALRGALNPPFIEPAGADDANPNPPDRPEGIFIVREGYTPAQEIKQVVHSLARYLPDHPDQTVAVLVPRNERGAKLVEELKSAGIQYVELLRSSLSTRQTASILQHALRMLSEPASTPRLVEFYRLLRSSELEQPERKAVVQKAVEMVRHTARLEDYLWPGVDQDLLVHLQNEGLPASVLEELDELRDMLRRWQNASLLPIDQLLLTISQDLFTNPAELALAHKLALFLESLSQAHPEWRLEQFTQELGQVAENRRKFTGFDDDDTGFDPDLHRGKVVVATIHKAKGLEWDRVYLLSVNNYDFPSADLFDSFIAEKWYLRDQLNLQAETLAQLQALFSGDDPGGPEGLATRQSRLEYAAERLRLLFVAITRAKSELIITWNTGKNSDLQAARPLAALKTYLEGHH
ncbi:MAG: ATP-dependent helicase [Chloroflexi bacterium]|nr:ATP-dependent helicase [Chloroflexota bacterium]